MTTLNSIRGLTRCLLAMTAALLIAGCSGFSAEPTAELDPLLFRSEANHVSVMLPAGWAAAEGPADLSARVLIHAPQAVVSFNNWGAAGFWAVAQVTETADTIHASYGPEVVQAQLPAGGVYVVLTHYEYVSGILITDPHYQEFTSSDVNALWPGGDCREKSIRVDFTKWGYGYALELMCAPDASTEAVEQAQGIIDSLRFDDIPAGDPGWAVLQARALIPEPFKPQQFGGGGTHGSEDGTERTTWTEVLEDRTVRVTLIYTGGMENIDLFDRVFETVDGRTVVHPERCRWWQVDVHPDGTVVLVAMGGAALPR
jgi:hypothetical protein